MDPLPTIIKNTLHVNSEEFQNFCLCLVEEYPATFVFFFDNCNCNQCDGVEELKEVEDMAVEEDLRSKKLKKNQNKEIVTSSKNPVCPTEKATPSKGTICSTCHKTFSTKKILKRHSKIHSDEKSHPCPNQDCKMSFTRKDHLIYHMVKHTKEKPFSCDSCNEKFAYKRSRDKHLENKVCMK